MDENNAEVITSVISILIFQVSNSASQFSRIFDFSIPMNIFNVFKTENFNIKFYNFPDFFQNLYEPWLNLIFNNIICM